MKDFDRNNIKRIVVRGTNWVGDAVMTIPALRELRQLFPEAHLTLATRPWAQELFAEADFLDDVLVYDRRGLASVFGQVRAWRARNFDLAVLFQNAFEAALIPALARVPYRIGYATESRSFLLTHPLPLPEWRSSKHEVFYYLNIVAALERIVSGKERRVDDYQPDIGMRLSNQRRSAGADLLASHGVNSDRLVVALCPGSINSRAKRWPAERFAMLADSLIEAGVQAVLIGSAGELEVSNQMVEQMQHQPIVLTGSTTLSEAVEVLANTDLLITNDTGPAHIAAALGRPTLVIFGPTNPLTTQPFSSNAEVVRHPPDCAPCMLRDCPIDHRCMTAITPEELFSRAQAILSGRPNMLNPRPHPTGAVA
jgi:heptosyltransferase-2